MKEVIIFIFCIVLVALFSVGFDAYLIEKIWPSAGETKKNKEQEKKEK